MLDVNFVLLFFSLCLHTLKPISELYGEFLCLHRRLFENTLPNKRHAEAKPHYRNVNFLRRFLSLLKWNIPHEEGGACEVAYLRKCVSHEEN